MKKQCIPCYTSLSLSNTQDHYQNYTCNCQNKPFIGLHHQTFTSIYTPTITTTTSDITFNQTTTQWATKRLNHPRHNHHTADASFVNQNVNGKDTKHYFTDT
jgi:hypothetical protein